MSDPLTRLNEDLSSLGARAGQDKGTQTIVEELHLKFGWTVADLEAVDRLTRDEGWVEGIHGYIEHNICPVRMGPIVGGGLPGLGKRR